ncbi:MAG TPA: YhdP family protein [Burkholderiaceae bacterium]|nr:YhdP family protein [Burkholderiaceae bacterium]
MTINQLRPATAFHRFASYWQLIRQGYRYANIATHHTLGILFKLAIIAYFIFAALFLSLRYVVLPNIDRYKAEVEQIATRAIGQPVTISTIYASWQGLHPYLFLGGVVIHDRNGREALKLPGVAATFSWWSVPTANVRLHSLEISRPDLDIERDTNGNLYVGGIFIDTRKSAGGRGADWILSQREIVIRDGKLRWNDGKRAAPELLLNGVNFVLRNEWRQHKLALKAIPPAQLAAPLDVRADFAHPHFAQRISDVTQWKGQVYADLRDTDLAMWRQYVDYPVDLQSGRGAVRAWLSFDHARIADFTADLVLSNVAARLRKDLQSLNLVRVNGRVSVREKFAQKTLDGKPNLGTRGHTVSLTDFSLQTDEGLVLPATTISGAYLPARKGQPEKTEIKVRSLDLRALANLMERLPLTPAQLQMLSDFSPAGQLKNFSAQWQGTYPAISAYSVKGEFVGLSMKAQPARPARSRTAAAPAQAAVPAIPGFENLTGRVDANDRGGLCHLSSEQIKLDLPGYFPDPIMPFERLKMQASWSFQEKNQILVDIAKLDFVQAGIAGSLSGRHLMPLAAQQGKLLGTIDMTGHIARFDISQVGRYLPSNTPASLREWLTGGLMEGTASDVDIRLKGDLASFPFRTGGPAGKPNGEFRVAGKIENGKLNYTPGKFAKDGRTPFWPLLENINGTIAFDRTRMAIHADSARTHNVGLSNVSAVVPDLLSDDLLLDIDGSAAGALQDFVRYVNGSPVIDWIARFTEETRASGDAKLGLKLQLPLYRIEDAKVQGVLQFFNNDVVLQNAMPPIISSNGRLDFNERGVAINEIKANFLGGPVSVSGGTQRDGNIVVKAGGSVSSTGLQKAFTASAMQRLASRISGSARYSTTISVKKKRPEIVVESSLQGIALDFPAPLGKAAQESMPLRFELSSQPADDSATMRDEMKLSIGSAVAARYLRQKSAEKGTSWQVVRGGIGVNVPVPQPDSGLIANVNLKSLNIDAWNRLADSVAGGDKRREAEAAARSGALNIAQYIEPDILAARATELLVGGKKLDNVVVGASHLKDGWQVNIDSEQASGYVTWNEDSSGQGMGKVTARLASLTIPKSAASEVSDLLEGKNTTAQIPALDVVAENFQLFDTKLGHLELNAENVDGPEVREWRINKLSISNPDGALTATGKWVGGRGENLSNLDYALDIDNAGRLLDRLGFDNVLRGGKGKMSGDISWKGLPFSLDVPSLAGQLKLDMSSGQFLKVEPGAAKLLGVLSLQSLPRRLLLDFRDVFSEGFSFDGITATARVGQGMLKTDNFKMRGVNATVLLDGTADIAQESQDLHVVVIPEVNAGAASVVYALAVNPMIGVGSFLAQLFLRDPLMKAFTYEYKVTGPWKDPTVTKMDRSARNETKRPGAVTDGTEKAS